MVGWELELCDNPYVDVLAAYHPFIVAMYSNPSLNLPMEATLINAVNIDYNEWDNR